jgi:hypothetical protein
MMAIDANTFGRSINGVFDAMQSGLGEKRLGYYYPLMWRLAGGLCLQCPFQAFLTRSSHTILACSSDDRARFIFVDVRMSVVSVRCQRYTPSASALGRVSHYLIPPGVLHSCSTLPLRFISG